VNLTELTLGLFDRILGRSQFAASLVDLAIVAGVVLVSLFLLRSLAKPAGQVVEAAFNLVHSAIVTTLALGLGGLAIYAGYILVT